MLSLFFKPFDFYGHIHPLCNVVMYHYSFPSFRAECKTLGMLKSTRAAN